MLTNSDYHIGAVLYLDQSFIHNQTKNLTEPNIMKITCSNKADNTLFNMDYGVVFKSRDCSPFSMYYFDVLIPSKRAFIKCFDKLVITNIAQDIFTIQKFEDKKYHEPFFLSKKELEIIPFKYIGEIEKLAKYF